MIGLVLEYPSEEPLADHLVGLALDVPAVASDARQTRRRVVGAGDRETTLVLELLADRIRQLRVGHEHRTGLTVVEHEEPSRDPDLGRREPDAGCGDHRLHHVVEELAEGGPEVGDGFRRFAQDRIAQRSDAKDHVVTPGAAEGTDHRCGSASTRSTTPSAASSRSRVPNSLTRSGPRASKHTVRPSETETRRVEGSNGRTSFS